MLFDWIIFVHVNGVVVSTEVRFLNTIAALGVTGCQAVGQSLTHSQTKVEYKMGCFNDPA